MAGLLAEQVQEGQPDLAGPEEAPPAEAAGVAVVVAMSSSEVVTHAAQDISNDISGNTPIQKSSRAARSRPMEAR